MLNYNVPDLSGVKLETKKIPLKEVRIKIEKALARKIESEGQRKWLARQKRDAFVDVSVLD